MSCMKTFRVKMFYYSGAGNTQIIVNYLKERLTNDGHIVDITVLKKGTKAENLDSYDLIILATPVYSYHVPKTVKEFLSSLKDGNVPFYLLYTKGLILGNAAYEAYKMLRSKGYTVTGFSDIVLADTLFLLTARRGSLLEKFYLLPNRLFVPKVVIIYRSIIKALHVRKPIKLRRKGYAFITEFIGTLFQKKASHWEKLLLAQENCNLCKVCIQICPRENVKIESGKIIFGPDCEFCTACIHRCPSEAIQLDGFTKNKTRFSVKREYKVFRKILKQLSL